MADKKFKNRVRRGDRILSEKPFVYALQSKYRQQRCDYCLNETKVLKCSNCNYVYYCNRACQKQAWSLHKIECPLLKRIYPRLVPDAARMLCRLIIRLNNGGDLIRGYYTETCYRKFRDLMSHYKEIKNDPKRVEHLTSLHGVLNEMMINSKITLPNPTELLSIYGRLIINGFNILDDNMNSIATGIYLGVSVTDHSCKPNAVATFDGVTLHIHAIEDMEYLDWSKVFISYIDLLNPTKERHQDLMKNYYFYCTCSKCLDEKESIDMLAAHCPNESCSKPLDISLTNCPQCTAEITPKYRQEFHDIINFTKNHLDNMKENVYLDICKICLKRQKKYVHPLNVWHLKTLDAAFEAAIQIGKWTDVIIFGKQLLSGYRKYCGIWNPLTGILCLKMGKIHLYEENIKEALHYIEEAEKILTVTHGHDHRIILETLRPLLLEAKFKLDSKK